MLTTIRQGIIKTQNSPDFLVFNSGQVDFNADTASTIVTFADGSTDYLLTEDETITGAWTGPFSSGITHYLYWDIDKTTGARTFGSTTIAPSFGTSRPTSPSTDLHFFDKNIDKMLVWDGTTWVEKIRVFAGAIFNSVIALQPIGSQVAISETRRVGPILFDKSGNAIKRLSGQFLTSETPLNASNNPSNSYKIEAEQKRIKAVETIPEFRMVCFKGPNQIGLASSRDTSYRPAVGISVNEIRNTEVTNYVSEGYVENDNWNFTDVPGTLLFVGPSGEATTTVAQKISLQRIGQVVDSTTILLRLEELFKISDN